MTHLAMFGQTELWIGLGAVLLLFGAKKIPELARSMGSGINQFKKGLKDDVEPAARLEGDESEDKEADPE